MGAVGRNLVSFYFGGAISATDGRDGTYTARKLGDNSIHVVFRIDCFLEAIVAQERLTAMATRRGLARVSLCIHTAVFVSTCICVF